MFGAASTLVLAFLVETAVPADGAKTEPPAKERLVCRRRQVTGSLVQSVKVCRTQKEWQQFLSQTRDDLNRMDPHIFVEPPRG